MIRYLTAKRIIGPALTVLATLIYHPLVVVGLAPQTAAALFPFVVWAAYIAGLRGGLAAALWVGGYSFYAPPSDPWRSGVVLASAILTALMTGILKRRSLIAEETRRKAEVLDELNGNILILRETENRLSGLLDNWDAITDDARKRTVKEAYGKIVTLLTLVISWLALAREKGRLIREHDEAIQNNPLRGQ